MRKDTVAGMLKKKRIGVLMGGKSAERDVSLRSGRAVFNALKTRRYDVTAIDAGDSLPFDLKKKKVEMAFLVLHGGHGENGAIQGLLEVMNIPYTGSGVLSSALAMDKEASKKVFLYHGVPVTPFRVFGQDELPAGAKGIRTGFRMPWVVKPACEGSSVGVHIVKKERDLSAAVKDARSFGGKVIMEKYIRGKEVQIGILNDRVLGGVEVRPKLEFYSYEAKYTAGLTEYILPPELDRSSYSKAKNAALAAHKALGCRGATRVDLIVEPSGNMYVLEVNTIPGMTETSLLPKIALQAGFDFPDLLEEILRGIG